MGVAAVASAAGKGTGAISLGALGDDDPTATVKASTVVTDAATCGWGAAAAATEETGALGAGLCAATGDGGCGAGFIAEAVAAAALYPAPDCGVEASMTAGLGLAAVGAVGAAGLRCLA